MAAGLTVLALYGYPGNVVSGSLVDASSFTYSSGVSTTNAGSYIAGYMDGENRCKFFYTDGSTIALPTLTSVTEVTQVDSAGSTKVGSYLVVLAYSSASIDATSANSEIFLDPYGLLIKAGTAYG
jgi:hypothetical protein